VSWPQPLPRGGTIGICAPAGPVKRERLERAIARLQSAGYRIVISPHVYGEAGLFSASDETRVRDLHELFARRDVDAVFCARGGVGSSRILADLNGGLIADSGKPFLGFSDVTALQWYLWKTQRFVTFQGPLAVEWDGAVNDESLYNALGILAQDGTAELWNSTQRSAVNVLRPGKATTILAPLLPGNLTMITTLLGTSYMPELAGTILVLEDVNEPPHRVDRMLFHLKNAGALRNLAALGIGDLFEGENAQKRDQVLTALRDATSDTDYPLLAGIPFGHGAERATLPVGANVELNLNDRSLQLANVHHPVAAS
jgi:muramoyltetrapeptide carboxypeptidase